MRRRGERRGRRRRLQRARPLRLRDAADRHRRRRGVEGARREGDRRLPAGADAGDDARARRRRAEEGRAAREGGRAATARCSSGTSPRSAVAALGRRAVQAARRARRAGGVPPARRARRRRPLRARERDRQARDVGGRRRDHRGRRRRARRAARRLAAVDLTDAWGARDVGGVLRAAERMLDRTGDPRSQDDPARRRQPHEPRPDARAAPALEARGLSPAKDAASQARDASPFYVQKLYAQARNFSADELDDALVRLAELDHALKGGSRLANELELERALVEITRPREAAATLTCASSTLGAGAGCDARPATSCGRRRSGAARRARRPGRSASRGCGARSRSRPRRPRRRPSARRFVSVLIVER